MTESRNQKRCCEKSMKHNLIFVELKLEPFFTYFSENVYFTACALSTWKNHIQRNKSPTNKGYMVDYTRLFCNVPKALATFNETKYSVGEDFWPDIKTEIFAFGNETDDEKQKSLYLSIWLNNPCSSEKQILKTFFITFFWKKLRLQSFW